MAFRLWPLSFFIAFIRLKLTQWLVSLQQICQYNWWLRNLNVIILNSTNWAYSDTHSVYVDARPWKIFVEKMQLGWYVNLNFNFYLYHLLLRRKKRKISFSPGNFLVNWNKTELFYFGPLKNKSQRFIGPPCCFFFNRTHKQRCFLSFTITIQVPGKKNADLVIFTGWVQNCSITTPRVERWSLSKWGLI